MFGRHIKIGQKAGHIDPVRLTVPPGAVLDLASRAQRDGVRTIVITLQITEPVPRQQPQVYTLTSTVKLRNLNNL